MESTYQPELPELGTVLYDNVKLYTYLKTNTWEPIQIFRSLFIGFRVEFNEIVVPMTLNYFDYLVRTKFPIRLWYSFRYSTRYPRDQMIIINDFILSVLSYLIDDYSNFVAPENIPFLPSRLSTMVHEIECSFFVGAPIVRHGSMIIKYEPLISTKTLPDYVNSKYEVTIPLERILEFQQWLFDLFPSQVPDDQSWYLRVPVA